MPRRPRRRASGTWSNRSRRSKIRARGSRRLGKAFDLYWPRLATELQDVNAKFPIKAGDGPTIRYITGAETKVLNLLAQRKSLAEIAAATGTTINALRSQLASLRLKLGTPTGAELVAYARRRDLL
jgi:DNA-binding CsgD family transcriptional regulator